jgi:hypothetical protein
MKHAVAWMLSVALIAGVSVACDEDGDDPDSTATALLTPEADISEQTPSEAVFTALAGQIGTGDGMEHNWAQVLWEQNHTYPTWLCDAPDADQANLHGSFEEGDDSLNFLNAPLNHDFQDALDLDDEYDNWVYMPGLVGAGGFMLVNVNAHPVPPDRRVFVELSARFQGKDYHCVAPSAQEGGEDT